VAVFADTPVLCGHRGSGRGIVDGRRENTLESYRAAVAHGLRWVEVDARVTADDVLVARHDPVTDDGRFVADLTAAETDAAGLTRCGRATARPPRSSPACSARAPAIGRCSSPASTRPPC
jgi:glycerophosphoryl diester phosphodiesterase